MFEQTFKTLDNIMFQEYGCTSELDYFEQSSWRLSLKYLDDLKSGRAGKAELDAQPYTLIFATQYRRSEWAAPKRQVGFILRDARGWIDELEFSNQEQELEVSNLYKTPTKNFGSAGRK
jgi:type I restriction enzyme M protein